MFIPAKNNSITSSPNWPQILEGMYQKTGYELNCMRIGIVQTWYPEDLTVDVNIANKKTIQINQDGTKTVTDFAPIRAKVVYCNPFETYPIKAGDECVLLFADREIESWFINGEANPESYPRMHEMTDAVAIFGIRSLPNMITVLTNCLHLFYGSSDIQVKDTSVDITTTTINITGNTTQTGNTVQTGDITATNLSATAAATGTFTTADSKTITVTNGIITAIT